jgi:hypothetical protein
MPTPTDLAGPRFEGPDRLLRALAVLALVWGLVYLVWRGWDTGQGAQPVMFWLLYASEVFGLVMLASFTLHFPGLARPRLPAAGHRMAAHGRRLRVHL